MAAPLIPIVPGAVASAADDADAFEMKKDEAVPRQAGQTINFAQHYHHSGVAIDRPPAPVILGKAKGFTRLTDMKPGQLTLSFRFQEHITSLQMCRYLVVLNLATNRLSLFVTDEMWVDYIKKQTPPELDDNFNVT